MSKELRLNPGKLLTDASQLGIDYFDIPQAQWSNSVDILKTCKAIKLNAAGTIYIMTVDSDVMEPWTTDRPEIIPMVVKRVGASTDVGLIGMIKGIL